MMGRAFSPHFMLMFNSQGVALGWYGVAPLALVHGCGCEFRLAIEGE